MEGRDRCERGRLPLHFIFTTVIIEKKTKRKRKKPSGKTLVPLFWFNSNVIAYWPAFQIVFASLRLPTRFFLPLFFYADEKAAAL